MGEICHAGMATAMVNPAPSGAAFMSLVPAKFFDTFPVLVKTTFCPTAALCSSDQLRFVIRHSSF
ncbi:MAG: hypothetical protein EXS35_15170 [Pedosphaera sp.]|nr:hypothetical protein [Pedosphaera sp.]